MFIYLRHRGFTLLELIVVIVILGILASIAIPTFNGVITKSKDASARQTLASLSRNAMSLGALDRAARSTPTAADLTTAISEVRLANYTTAPDAKLNADAVSVGQNAVGYAVSGASYGFALRSQSGACLLLVNTAGSDTLFRPADGVCTGTRAVSGKVGSDTDVASGGGGVVVITPSIPAPSNVSAALSGTSATISFTVPTGNTSNVSSYTVLPSSGTASASGAASPLTITGLDASTSYTFTVRVNYADGTNSVSPASNSITTPAPVVASTFAPAPTGTGIDSVRTGTLRTFTAPSDGLYNIEAWGAQGSAASSRTAGKGAYATGTVRLTANQQLTILVGQTGRVGGGGGGSFVATGPTNTSTPLVIAGGGGGANADITGQNASTTTSGTNGTGSTTAVTGVGGTGGNGGTGGAGGGGFNTAGSSLNYGSDGFNGGGGAYPGTGGRYGYDDNNWCSTIYASHGGYGGGGSTAACGSAPGGGGGYSGGGGFGGGGGSYVASSFNSTTVSDREVNNTTKANATQGKVVITRVGS